MHTGSRSFLLAAPVQRHSQSPVPILSVPPEQERNEVSPASPILFCQAAHCEGGGRAIIAHAGPSSPGAIRSPLRGKIRGQLIAHPHQMLVLRELRHTAPGSRIQSNPSRKPQKTPNNSSFRPARYSTVENPALTCEENDDNLRDQAGKERTGNDNALGQDLFDKGMRKATQDPPKPNKKAAPRTSSVPTSAPPSTTPPPVVSSCTVTRTPTAGPSMPTACSLWSTLWPTLRELPRTHPTQHLPISQEAIKLGPRRLHERQPLLPNGLQRGHRAPLPGPRTSHHQPAHENCQEASPMAANDKAIIVGGVGGRAGGVGQRRDLVGDRDLRRNVWRSKCQRVVENHAGGVGSSRWGPGERRGGKETEG
ncbi:hypothetical protein BDK51DRAFT_43607 [Blyttiomyces helicus]|uniref:Uncharacterized protein n=1 Tax=Blyttiomyces helicus TaxID=388810 RepID=A0A4P9WGL7_9FUNG|nr:hypothetical protein BDK51DRAFT_43607 [Blyttiomyces helicus]|eukprot:RKO90180.1 hypothetical protein BDK51DRAFT_43607 [Blyttiomyces helicus]